MLISSSFSFHLTKRVDSSTADNLKFAIDYAKEISEKAPDIVIPSLFLCIRDGTKLMTESDKEAT